MVNRSWSERVQVQRTPSRGSYDLDVVRAVLAEAFYAHVGFVIDSQPYVIPMVYGTTPDTIYLHGSTGSRQVRALSEGIPICVTVTNMRALVLARSALNLSVNYQSVVMLGEARRLQDDDEKMRALETITEHVVPERWAGVRKPTGKELSSVGVLALPIAEASVKVRNAPPYEEADDELLPLWGGLIPLTTVYGPAEPDQWVSDATPAPPSVTDYTRPLAPVPPEGAFDASRAGRTAG